MSRAGGACVCVLTTVLMWGSRAQAQSAPDGGVSSAEVDALLKELEAAQASAPPAPGAPAPATPPGLTHPGPALPAWVDALVPVLALRLRPMVQAGHPDNLRNPALQGQLRGWLGAEAHPSPAVAGRLMLGVRPELPGLRAPGPDLLVDGWVRYRTDALGGELTVRAGRQALVGTPLILAANDFEQLPPRFDGVTLELRHGHLFAQAMLAAEALTVLPAQGALPAVNGVAWVQAGVDDGPGRLLEAHAMWRAPDLPVQGDGQERRHERARADVGGRALFTLWGAWVDLAADLQQERFTMPSVWWPALGAAGSAGWAPPWDWAMGLYGEAGVRAGVGQPLRMVPWLADRGVMDGVQPLEFDPLYGQLHGVSGAMDLVRMRNMVDMYGRAGMRRGPLTNLALTYHNLSLLDPAGAWWAARGERPLLAAGEGGPQPFVGHEVDVSASAQLTRHASVGGAVGLLWSGPKAREAGFGPFAHTGFVAVEFTW